MSLLIPSQNDYIDARAGYKLLPQYHQRLGKLEKLEEFKWEFLVVQGFFKQSDGATDDLAFNYATHDFGITKPWDQIIEELNQLNANADENTRYKLLFNARHGQGYHNVVVLKYGSEEWHRKWHKYDRDGDIIIGPDPELTELGIAQARENHDVWTKQLEKGCPLPTRFFASPLQRSCKTLLETMQGLWPQGTKVIVTDRIREIIGYHLCNKRSPKLTVIERFGQYGFEPEASMTEEDEEYGDDEEPFDDMCLRLNKFLQYLFEYDDTVISTTSHGGVIKCLLAVLGHRNFTISTGGMIPVVVKATKIQK